MHVGDGCVPVAWRAVCRRLGSPRGSSGGGSPARRVRDGGQFRHSHQGDRAQVVSCRASARFAPAMPATASLRSLLVLGWAVAVGGVRPEVLGTELGPRPGCVGVMSASLPRWRRLTQLSEPAIVSMPPQIAPTRTGHAGGSGARSWLDSRTRACDSNRRAGEQRSAYGPCLRSRRVINQLVYRPLARKSSL